MTPPYIYSNNRASVINKKKRKVQLFRNNIPLCFDIKKRKEKNN